MDVRRSAVTLVMMQTSAILYADFMNVIILGMNEKLGYTLQRAGEISSLNLSCIAFGALIGALFPARLAGAPHSSAYLLAIAVADAASMCATPWQMLAPLRALHGLACGGLLACCGGLMSYQRRPERIMGAALAIQLLLASLSARLFPAVVLEHGLAPVFLVMAVTELATAALVLRSLRHLPAAAGRSAHAARPAGSLDAPPAPGGSLPPQARLLCVASMAALFLFQFSRFMVVGYGFHAGQYFALERPYVGAVISASNWLAGAGAVLATMLPARAGRTWPLLLAGLGNLLSACTLIGFGTDPAVFAIATCASALLTFVALPYHYGVCFAIDPRGAWGIWTGFVSKLGLALGPAAGAVLLTQHSLPTLLGISAVLVCAATLLACWPARCIDAIDR